MTYTEYLEELYEIVIARYELAAARVEAMEDASRVENEAKADGVIGERDPAKLLRERDDALHRRAAESFARGTDHAAFLFDLFSLCGCSRFERHAAAMLLFWELRPECRKANLALFDYPHVSPELLRLTYEGEYLDDEAWLSLCGDSVFGRVFLAEQTGRGVDRPLALSPRLLKRILGGWSGRDDEAAVRLARAVFEEGSPIPRAQRVDCRFTLEDVVLPSESMAAIRMACERVKNAAKVYGEWGMGRLVTYGKGVSLLFAGPPGTGKTMTAQAVARRLSMELFRVNLPAVVSKYVGETEQHLSEIFEHALGRQVVLFFDEADVLFGKRTEIKDANDKYSNMEAAYLLQRIEEYEGVTILATNYRQNFDEAFNRRLTATIQFPFPDEESRLAIWEKVVPESLLPEEGLELHWLAKRFELTGSAIKNVVLFAAFQTAAEGESALSMDRILAGVREEYKKQGKILSRDEMMR